MRKPTKKQVLQAIRRDHECGKKKLLDALVLSDGTLVVHYEVRSWVADLKQYHVQRRLTLEAPTGRRPSIITHSWWEDKESK